MPPQTGAICKYFLSGSCKYGANCKFTHPDASKRSEFKSVDEIIDFIKKNLTEYNIWKYSCFGIYGAMLISGDVQFEELRWMAYQASRNGSFDKYNLYLQSKTREFQTSRANILGCLSEASEFVLQNLFSNEITYYNPEKPSNQLHENRFIEMDMVNGLEKECGFNFLKVVIAQNFDKLFTDLNFELFRIPEKCPGPDQS
ncbi:hypothetical protein O9G_000611 [Rozella allomycis CSF55]|uniref:C3H1-type domain-containing protein n=1 Tax=Rozella allomycis (strain CSF55) TaxID=988480 RepID=A0A075B0E2_ROZAC|nr:hypothetical protein O9G_000611 [Rozella allomycis CSF55]|eukprot:EPZ34424.1 hypothetical protein O9G_000611 [Rozella allomycis CSF55]